MTIGVRALIIDDGQAERESQLQRGSGNRDALARCIRHENCYRRGDWQ